MKLGSNLLFSMKGGINMLNNKKTDWEELAEECQEFVKEKGLTIEDLEEVIKISDEIKKAVLDIVLKE